MYQQDAKEEKTAASSKDREAKTQNHQKSSISAQTPMSSTTPTPSQGSKINAPENDPSLDTINYRNCFSGSQSITQAATGTPTAIPQRFPTSIETGMHQRAMDAAAENTWRRASVFGSGEYGTTDAASLGPPAGDVSLTLGLRHTGNLPDTSRRSLRDFGAC